jgi:hypothetical protein
MAPLTVKFRHSMEQLKPCCESTGIITAAGIIVCAQCGRRRGSLSAVTAAALETITKHFGTPTEPLIIRDQSRCFKDEKSETGNR